MSKLDDCADALEVAIPAAKMGNAQMAKTFADVVRSLKNQDAPEALEMTAAAHFGAAWIKDAQGRGLEAQKRRLEALALIERAAAPSRFLASVDAIADALLEMGEYVRSLPYCNQAVELTRQNRKAAPRRLWRAGRCYSLAGFSAASLAPLETAVEMMKADADSPLKAHALRELGTAKLKCNASDGSPALAEAADMFERLGQMSHATTSWSNLGLASARAGRLAEALAWYEKVRAVRESEPSTSRTQLGALYNNFAGVYRRMGDFERARAEIRRAFEVLSPVGGEFVAHTQGSLGEICRDAGEPVEAHQWFARARAGYEALPSPNVERLAEKLENEAAALEALGRAEEAAPLRRRAETLRAQKPPPPPASPAGPAMASATEPSGVVVVRLDGAGLSDEIYARCDLDTLERRLERRLGETGVGELDGHEHGPETVQLFLYGPDARAVFEAVAPTLRGYPLCQGATIELRQGESRQTFPLEAATLH